MCGTNSFHVSRPLCGDAGYVKRRTGNNRTHYDYSNENSNYAGENIFHFMSPYRTELKYFRNLYLCCPLVCIISECIVSDVSSSSFSSFLILSHLVSSGRHCSGSLIMAKWHINAYVQKHFPMSQLPGHAARIASETHRWDSKVHIYRIVCNKDKFIFSASKR